MTFISRIDYRPRMVDFQLLLSQPGERTLLMTLSGELDMETTEPLREASRAATASGDYDSIVFDLTELTFVDSSGLHALTDIHRKMTEAGGTTRIVCSNSSMLRLFALTGLADYFTIVPERTAAFEIAA
jgi:anti-sigma B factor antagonist